MKGVIYETPVESEEDLLDRIEDAWPADKAWRDMIAARAPGVSGVKLVPLSRHYQRSEHSRPANGRAKPQGTRLYVEETGSTVSALLYLTPYCGRDTCKNTPSQPPLGFKKHQRFYVARGKRICTCIPPVSTHHPLSYHRLATTPSAALRERLDCSPPTKANRVKLHAGSLPDVRKRESCRTMPLVGGFSRGSPVSPALSFRCCSILTSLHPHRLSRAPCQEPPKFLHSPNDIVRNLVIAITQAALKTHKRLSGVRYWLRSSITVNVINHTKQIRRGCRPIVGVLEGAALCIGPKTRGRGCRINITVIYNAAGGGIQDVGSEGPAGEILGTSPLHVRAVTGLANPSRERGGGVWRKHITKYKKTPVYPNTSIHFPRKNVGLEDWRTRKERLLTLPKERVDVRSYPSSVAFSFQRPGNKRHRPRATLPYIGCLVPVVEGVSVVCDFIQQSTARVLDKYVNALVLSVWLSKPVGPRAGGERLTCSPPTKANRVIGFSPYDAVGRRGKQGRNSSSVASADRVASRRVEHQPIRALTLASSVEDIARTTNIPHFTASFLARYQMAARSVSPAADVRTRYCEYRFTVKPVLHDTCSRTWFLYKLLQALAHEPVYYTSRYMSRHGRFILHDSSSPTSIWHPRWVRSVWFVVRNLVWDPPRKIGRVQLPNLVRSLALLGGRCHGGCHTLARIPAAMADLAQAFTESGIV
ncbi:hypothetical protein PR048_033666 [Dryococelus australis]|uniref:Uncharacterized protein n=1 Tax=Dryococelus australis TaxID=614101 RepID=A0ABQ9G3Y2_9NEOP|nr:hypothetical protein PR048_033666 [Dryococelus australis]